MLVLGLCTLHLLLTSNFTEEIGRLKEHFSFLPVPVKVTLAVGFSLQLVLVPGPWTLSELQHKPAQPLSPTLWRASSALASVSPTSWLLRCPARFTQVYIFCTNDLRGHLYQILNFQMYLGLFLDFQFYSIGLFVNSCVNSVLFVCLNYTGFIACFNIW